MLVSRTSPRPRRLPRDAWSATWEAIGELRALGVSDEDRAYLLPNAVAIRFTESADLLHLHHKLEMRLCYNAQEEIWRASPRRGAADPRGQPAASAATSCRPARCGTSPRVRPICPEGDRYCGVRVWKQDQSEYTRAL